MTCKTNMDLHSPHLFCPDRKVSLWDVWLLAYLHAFHYAIAMSRPDGQSMWRFEKVSAEEAMGERPVLSGCLRRLSYLRPRKLYHFPLRRAWPAVSKISITLPELCRQAQA